MSLPYTCSFGSLNLNDGVNSFYDHTDIAWDMTASVMIAPASGGQSYRINCDYKPLVYTSHGLWKDTAATRYHDFLAALRTNSLAGGALALDEGLSATHAMVDDVQATFGVVLGTSSGVVLTSRSWSIRFIAYIN